MAHRQSYKEEPGVAVAGDHVSTQLFFSLSFSINCCNQAIGCDYRTRTRALLCNHVSVRGTRAFISLGYFNFYFPFFFHYHA